MKDCPNCGGSGAMLLLTPYNLPQHFAKLCPCVTERLRKLEAVAEAAKRVGATYKISNTESEYFREAMSALKTVLERVAK